MRSLWIALGLTVAAAPAIARDCYRAARVAYGSERFDEAGRLFSESAADPACAASRVRLLISAGEAFRRGAERSGEAQGYCRAADAYQRAAKLADRQRLADIAAAGAEATVALCLTREAPPEPPATPAPNPPEAPVADPIAAEASAPPPIGATPVDPPTERAGDESDTSDDDGMSTVWVITGIAAGAAVGIGVAWLVASSGDEEPSERPILVFTGE